MQTTTPRLARPLVIGMIAAAFVLASTARAGDFTAYAGPNIFGPWTQVGAHAGPATYSISAKPLGKTTILGEVRYHGVDGTQKVVPFYGSITVTTCNCYGTVEVRFKGTPFGSAVDVRVRP